jgi:N-acetylmuramoyl-L-alanine amidase CwlA
MASDDDAAKMIVEQAENKLRAYDASGAFTLYDSVLRKPDVSMEVKFAAMLGVMAIKTIQGEGTIEVPGVRFEYYIMDKVFCENCKEKTENTRRSGSTQYLATTIIDHWFAECKKCGKLKNIAFEVPKDSPFDKIG